ncbi:unnamed protein product [Lactuca saligna]|uniref:Uncharacterized protein n=1 Tax=Lactuca saligna TaxID=75948 RepID=A0AA36ECB4_LACSI|nr:unnamed protein product [Lactuca saligna]
MCIRNSRVAESLRSNLFHGELTPLLINDDDLTPVDPTALRMEIGHHFLAYIRGAHKSQPRLETEHRTYIINTVIFESDWDRSISRRLLLVDSASAHHRRSAPQPTSIDGLLTVHQVAAVWSTSFAAEDPTHIYFSPYIISYLRCSYISPISSQSAIMEVGIEIEPCKICLAKSVYQICFYLFTKHLYHLEH